MYKEGAIVSEQFARTGNMFHATCYYNPISYSPLNLKRHYFSSRPAGWLAESLESAASLPPVFQEEHEVEKETGRRGVREVRKENIQPGAGFIRL